MSREECIRIAQRIHDAWSDAGICYGRDDDGDVVTDDMKALAQCEDNELSSIARFIIEDAESNMQDDLYYDSYAEYIGQIEERMAELEDEYNASAKKSKKMKKSDEYEKLSPEAREHEINYLYGRIRSLMLEDTIEELDNSYEYTWGTCDYENEEEMDCLDEAYDRIKAEIENKNASTKKMNIRKENVTEIEVNGEPYFIWESFNGFQGSKENPDQYITNARAVLDFNRNDGFESIQDVIDYINQYFVKSTKKMKKSVGMYGQVEQVSDMSSDARRIYEYKVKLDIDGFSGFVYIWWRVFEQDGTYRLMRLEGNGIEGLSEELRNTYFSTLDEAISCADNWTDKIKEKMMSLYGHGMDTSWSDNDIDSYNNFGDSIKSTKKSTPSIHDMISQIRTNNNSLKRSRVDLKINKSDDWIRAWENNTLGRYDFTINVDGQSVSFSIDMGGGYFAHDDGTFTYKGTEVMPMMSLPMDTEEEDGIYFAIQDLDTTDYIDTMYIPAKEVSSFDEAVSMFQQYVSKFNGLKLEME